MWEFDSVVSYLKLHRKALMFTGSLALFGTLLTSYGFIIGNTTLIILGPVIATLGKILISIAIFGPKFIEIVSTKFRSL